MGAPTAFLPFCLSAFLPLPCVFTPPFVAKTPPLPCVPTAFATKTPPFAPQERTNLDRIRKSQVHAQHSTSALPTPSPFSAAHPLSLQ